MHVREAGLELQVFSQPQRAHSILVLIHGLHPKGPSDARFLAFANTCAEAGFLVLAPDISAFRDFKITLETRDQIVTLVDALPKYFEQEALRNVGLLGISYGAGSAFLAAAEPSLQQKIHYLISIGGYYNLNHAIDFLITGGHGNTAQVEGRTPQWWGRMIFAVNNLNTLAPQEDRKLFMEILMLRLTLQEPSCKEDLLTSDGAAFLSSLINGLSPELTTQFLLAAGQHRDFFDRLSPDGALHRWNRNLRIYLLHGRTDSLIPFEETIELANKMKELGFSKVHSLITASLTHVDINISTRFREGLRLLSWIQAVLGEADIS